MATGADVRKRVLDVVIAAAGLVVASPIIAIVALAVRSTCGRPVVFRQLRTGLHGCGFVIWKFRTMTDARDNVGQLLPDDQRLTQIGRFIRRLSLDELPQLWNVLRGDMSLVGPRPLLPEYLPRYTAFQRLRHEVKPGITGWAQINGRNALTWEQKFELDVWYVDHWSVALDLKILALTVVQVFRPHGINRDGYATTPYFTGNDSPELGRE